MREIKTRHPGVRARHADDCPALDGARCRCGGKGYIARLRGHDGKQIARTFPSASAAHGWRSDLLGAKSKGRTTPTTSSPTLGDAFEQWKTAARAGTARKRNRTVYSHGTIATLASAFAAHLKDDLGQKRMDRIRRGDVQALVDSLVGDLSPARIRVVVTALRVTYRYAVTRDLVHANPIDYIELPQVPLRGGGHVELDPHKVRAFLDLVPATDRAIWTLLAYTGMRVSEAITRRVEHIDLAGGWVDIPGGAKSEYGVRRIPLIEPAIVALTEHRLRHPQAEMHELLSPPLNRHALQMSQNGLRERARNATGGLFMNPHRLRHTCTTWLMQAGVSTAVRSAWMGQSTRGMAVNERVYTHVGERDLKQAAAALQSFLDHQTDHQGAQTLALRPSQHPRG